MTRSTTGVPVQPRRPGDPQVDLRLYTVAHRAMQQGSRELADLAAGVRDGRVRLTPRRARDLRTYVGFLCDDVHLHHKGEDEIGWPIITGSAGAHVDLEPLSADHDELDPILDKLRAAARRLVADPADAQAAAVLAAESAMLRDLLHEHIAEEERDVFPVIKEYVSVADFSRWENEVMAHYPKANLWWLIPWSVAAVPAEEVPAALARTPLAFRVAYRLFRGRYARHHRRLFG